LTIVNRQSRLLLVPTDYTLAELYRWCAVPAERLEGHPDLKVRLRIVAGSAEMGELMAGELIDQVASNNARGQATRAIIPCGPMCWYEPFARRVNRQRLNLANLHVYHMDECLDWQGRLLPEGHPYNFRSTMERVFYGPVAEELAVPPSQRHFLTPDNAAAVADEIAGATIDLTLGGWGQDGHVAYNQARREPYSPVSVEELAASTARVQYNNPDTVIALAQRTFGGAWQFVPPMSVTLGMKECLSAGKVRLFSDTGAWKQTALRVALFGPVTPEYPITLLQRHPDAVLTATRDTASHPVSLHPQWQLF
jgi:glucosamine-6-phosphate deaminase